MFLLLIRHSFWKQKLLLMLFLLLSVYFSIENQSNWPVCHVRMKNIAFIEEKFYLSLILNLHSSGLVSHTISGLPLTSTLDKAFEKIQDDKSYSPFWPGLAASTQTISADAPAEHKPKKKLPGQRRDRKLFGIAQKCTAVSARISIHGTLPAGTHWIPGLLQQSQAQGKAEGLEL